MKLEEENFERLNKLIEELREDDRIKLVEGEKDKRALEYFGIKNIRMVHGNSLQKLASKIDKDVILLMDFDRTGKILTKKMADLLKNESIHADLNYRRELRKYAKISNIEELVVKYNNLIDKIRGERNGKDVHRYGKICNLRSLRNRWSCREAGRSGGSLWAD